MEFRINGHKPFGEFPVIDQDCEIFQLINCILDQYAKFIRRRVLRCRRQLARITYWYEASAFHGNSGASKFCSDLISAI